MKFRFSKPLVHVRKYADDMLEDYLDDEEQFWDYHTGEVDGDDIFDITTTGMGSYNDFLPSASARDKEYLEKEKNLIGKIVYMTPEQYYAECAKLFGASSDKLKQQRSHDKDTMQHLRQVIEGYRRKFPVPMLNYASTGQEGLHRAMVAGEMFGWDSIEIPVLVVNWASEERHAQAEKRKRTRELEYKLSDILHRCLYYEYSSFDEFFEEAKWLAEREFEDDVIIDAEKDLKIHTDDNTIYLDLFDASATASLDDVKIVSDN